MKNLAMWVVFAISLILSTGRASAGSPSTETVQLVVDGSTGSDLNPGTASKPFKTIGKAAEAAMANLRKNIPTTVTINPGTYREFIQIAGTSPTVGAPVTFQASKTGTVIVSGSDLWKGWQRDSANSHRYTHSWPFQWGVCTVPAGWPTLQEIVLRREMILVNGKLLTQVLSLDQMTEGSFFVDEVNDRAYIWPSGISDIDSATVEVAVRPQLFESYQVPHLTISGLTFEYANSCISTRQRSAVAIVAATDETVEDTAIIWNNWTGLALFGVTNSVVQRISSNNNGELGIDGYKLKNLTSGDVEASYNNWRGAWGGFLSWETGGSKFLLLHGGVFRNYKAVGNQGRGIWFDTDNLDITLDKAFLSQNRMNGILVEANMGPISLTNSRVCGNYQGGVVANQSASVELTGDLLYGNQLSQIAVYGGSGPRTGTNWETGAKFVASSQNWSFSQNSIVGDATGQSLFMIQQSPTAFITSLTSNNNTWHDATNPNVFQFDTSSSSQNLDLSGWRSTTGQDRDSTTNSPQTDPAALCAAP
jgi:hypothetical protein